MTLPKTHFGKVCWCKRQNWPHALSWVTVTVIQIDITSKGITRITEKNPPCSFLLNVSALQKLSSIFTSASPQKQLKRLARRSWQGSVDMWALTDRRSIAAANNRCKIGTSGHNTYQSSHISKYGAGILPSYPLGPDYLLQSVTAVSWKRKTNFLLCSCSKACLEHRKEKNIQTHLTPTVLSFDLCNSWNKEQSKMKVVLQPELNLRNFQANSGKGCCAKAMRISNDFNCTQKWKCWSCVSSPAFV